MEPNGLPGGMYSTMGSGMLGLEMSLHHHPQPHPQQSSPLPLQQQHPHPQMVGYAHQEADHHSQTQQSVKQIYPYPPKAKPQQLTLSDEDDHGLNAEDSAGGGDDGKRKASSPWHRMKWTDGMVRLLIKVVFYIGDEVGSEGTDAAGKKKAGGALQKKGKWKSVSKAMMQSGFYVSPQQCEDKFNDLNKRYKRVNDILGKGTACRVVENQSLLDTMDHLSPKMKEEARKLLNSKHLFFREMCAYHNSCATGSGGVGGIGGSGVHHSPEVAAEPAQIQQQRCFHSSENVPIVPNSGRMEMVESKLAKGGIVEEEDDDYEEEEEEDDDEDDEEEEDEVVGSGARGQEEDNGSDEKCSRKRPRKGAFALSSPLIQQLSTELMSVVQDGTKSPLEKRQWMNSRLMQLEEQRVGYQLETYKLEKQRLKWVKFSCKKEREMERDKLKNERMRLENERMLLLFRQKELELLDLHHHQQQISSSKRTDPSSISG